MAANVSEPLQSTCNYYTHHSVAASRISSDHQGLVRRAFATERHTLQAQPPGTTKKGPPKPN
jgi:hypothetical protein